MYMRLEALTCKCSLHDQLCVFVSIPYIRQEFSEYKEKKIVSTILFEDDAITLDLPPDPVNGWKFFLCHIQRLFMLLCLGAHAPKAYGSRFVCQSFCHSVSHYASVGGARRR